MSRLRQRFWDGKSIVAQCGHEGVFFEGGEPRHVHPGAGAVLEIVAVGLDGAEGDAAEAVDFEDALDAELIGDDEDVAFFADADLVADAVDGFGFAVGV